MNTTPNGTFTFPAVVKFEIDPDTAANLLVESDPSEALTAWINTQHVAENSGVYNATNLREALGTYLAEKKVSQARLLLPCTDESKLIC